MTERILDSSRMIFLLGKPNIALANMDFDLRLRHGSIWLHSVTMMMDLSLNSPQCLTLFYFSQNPSPLGARPNRSIFALDLRYCFSCQQRSSAVCERSISLAFMRSKPHPRSPILIGAFATISSARRWRAFPGRSVADSAISPCCRATRVTDL